MCQMHQEISLQSCWPFVFWNVLLILKSLCCIPNGEKNRNPSRLINTVFSPLEIILFVKSKPDSLGRLIMIQEQPRPSEQFSRGESVYMPALKRCDTSGDAGTYAILKTFQWRWFSSVSLEAHSVSNWPSKRRWENISQGPCGDGRKKYTRDTWILSKIVSCYRPFLEQAPLWRSEFPYNIQMVSMLLV